MCSSRTALRHTVGGGAFAALHNQRKAGWVEQSQEERGRGSLNLLMMIFLTAYDRSQQQSDYCRSVSKPADPSRGAHRCAHGAPERRSKARPTSKRTGWRRGVEAPIKGVLEVVLVPSAEFAKPGGATKGVCPTFEVAAWFSLRFSAACLNMLNNAGLLEAMPVPVAPSFAGEGALGWPKRKAGVEVVEGWAKPDHWPVDWAPLSPMVYC